jgi:hypothetical protein
VIGLDDLAAAAAVGTNRRATLPDLTGLESVLPPRSDDERALALLDAGAALTVVSAGAIAVPAGTPLPVAPADTTPPAPAGFAALLRQAASDAGPVRDAASRVDVLVEALGWLTARGMRLPHRLLTTFLGHPAREVRAASAGALGERGRWLAALPGAPWSRAPLPPTADAWQHGTPDEQVAHLTALRGSAPAEALRIVAEQWGATPAPLRARFASAIVDTVAPADEAFLESCLKDRSAPVRRIAADGLASLPASDYVRRMISRAPGVLRLVPGSPPILTVAPPAPDERDQLGATLSGQARLTRLLSAIPPAAWPGLCGITAAEALAMPQKPPAFDLRPGLTTAALRYRDAGLATALAETGAVHEGFAPLVPVDTLALALDRLGLSAATPDPETGTSLLRRLPRPWPPPIARAVLTHLSPSLPASRRLPAATWHLVAVALPAADAARWADDLREEFTSSGTRTAADRAVLDAAAVLTVRQALWRALPPSTEPTPGSTP